MSNRSYTVESCSAESSCHVLIEQSEEQRNMHVGAIALDFEALPEAESDDLHSGSGLALKRLYKFRIGLFISEVYPEENFDINSEAARSNTEIWVQFYYSPEFKDITPGTF